MLNDFIGADLVLPARAGMSPTVKATELMLTCAPRTRGDEPDTTAQELVVDRCSPHARG